MLSDVTQRSWPQPIIIPPLSQNVRLRPGGRDDWVLWYFCVHDGNPKVRMQNWFVWLRLQLSRSTLILPHRRLSCCHRQTHTVKENMIDRMSVYQNIICQFMYVLRAAY